MSKKIQLPRATKGYGYVGVWSDGYIGWECAPHVTGKDDKKSPHSSDVKRNDVLKGKRLFLCKIDITPLKDKKGRPITKIIRSNKP